ncbi:hypothetical protein DCAR_0417205 [Daucus carota subsp. sativus]|uniref:Uncharacterized protein n=1 Tax=Daucus carota subsp. sativus TaxID=79200 RepID=A0A165Y6M7_DAUCS|nr:hypothetical protein DCAR_0417205 [Daucus carota subsp. sativus]
MVGVGGALIIFWIVFFFGGPVIYLVIRFYRQLRAPCDIIENAGARRRNMVTRGKDGSMVILGAVGNGGCGGDVGGTGGGDNGDCGDGGGCGGGCGD